MDILSWFSDVPFWKKMFSMTLFAGVTLFIVELFKLLDGWNIKLRKTIKIAKESFHNDYAKTKELLKKKR